MILCPYCFELHDPAPAIFGEGGEPCSPPHCFSASCCADCKECSDFFMALEPEEGKVVHPKAASPSKLPGTVSTGEVAPVAAPVKKVVEDDIPW